ncbi:glycosyltransferase involved in cell wall biosynthesis [Prauserella shujinwangii]|uniref:Glycosyltransferase involved in cell wall biosynthesis n=1 Tax=Prauserella shujinwangii TaxID=1453103 RepID=A0A2T0M311_9PSEU|nr:glycosyltransferase family 4 protein [Prauserella shujinwangii]PRX51099.1 glycosyltransferase involved in cell wall biosynthesis [Prauserella shujinwangii]
MRVHAVLPGDVGDAAAPSGGDVYDQRVVRGLRELGVPVHEAAVPGAWPRPGAAAHAELARTLAGIPDGAVVLADGLVGCAAPGVLVPHARRLRLVVLVHLPLAVETGLPPGVVAELDTAERRCLHAARAIVVTGPWAARELVRRHGLPPGTVHTVPPGTDPAPPAPGTDGGSRLVCVASVTPRKGHDVLATALATIADLPWTCDCVGSLDRDPGFVTRLRAAIARHGLGDRMRLTGPRTGPPLDRTYAAADLLVLPSHAETYGMVVTEALARAVPVLASDVGGIPDALGRVPGGELPGLLVPPGDAGALADGLRRWLTDAALRRRLRDAAVARRNSLTGWDVCVQGMARVLEGVRE